MSKFECPACKEEKKHYAKGLCNTCWSRARYKALSERDKEIKKEKSKEYNKQNYPKIRESRKEYNKAKYLERKVNRALFVKRLKCKLRKVGESDIRIRDFYGVK